MQSCFLKLEIKLILPIFEIIAFPMILIKTQWFKVFLTEKSLNHCVSIAIMEGIWVANFFKCEFGGQDLFQTSKIGPVWAFWLIFCSFLRKSYLYHNFHKRISSHHVLDDFYRCVHIGNIFQELCNHSVDNLDVYLFHESYRYVFSSVLCKLWKIHTVHRLILVQGYKQ